MAPGAVGAGDGFALDADTLPEAFQRTAARYADAVALRTPDGVEISWLDYARRVRRLAGGLAAAGIGPGDTVAMMLTNRPEALMVDTAAMHLGAIPFSIYNSSSPEQIEYLLGNADAGVVVTEPQFLDRLLAARPKLSAVREVIVVGERADHGRSLDELLAAGDPDGFDFERTWLSVTPDDVATLIYTSGTTGPPKAVEVTHANVLAEFRAIFQLHPFRAGGRLVSWLPLAHLADRAAAHYPSLVSGASVTCVPEVRQAVVALPQIRPTLFLAVPRVWEKLKAALEPMLEAAGGPEERAALAGQLAANLGLDDPDLVLSGAAPIAPEVLEFFSELGIEIYEAWGMTETGAAATLAPRGAHRVGTVGKALPGVEVKLADDGELLVRGPIVMRGYRKDPERTAEAIDADGFMHTGDLGAIDADGYVTIIDRKKELIINAAGKNMSPANIENTIKAACPLIGSIIAIGDRRPYITALVTLDPDAAALATDPQIQAAVAAGIERGNARLSRVEQVRKHTLLPDAWVPGGEELTETMKLRRKPIAVKYAVEIEEMYAQ